MSNPFLEKILRQNSSLVKDINNSQQLDSDFNEALNKSKYFWSVVGIGALYVVMKKSFRRSK